MKCSENMQIGACTGYFLTEYLTGIIQSINTDGIELHINLKSTILYCVNNIKNENVYLNLKLLCKEDDVMPTLAMVNNGAFDLKNKLYWINNYDSVPIVINEEVDDAMALIVKDDVVLGSLEIL